MNKCRVCKKEIGEQYICIDGNKYYHIECRVEEKGKCKYCGREK